MHRPQWSRFVAVVVTALAALPAVAARAGADTPTPCPGAGGSVFGGFPLPPGTGEASGLVASTRHPGWGWMIRDSGNPPDLYAVRFPGAVAPHGLRAIRVLGATNVDWEDISEQDGRLYVTESDQSRRARYIYEIPEPDPLGPPRVHFSARYRYAYPNGQRFNTETTFFFAGHFVLVPKTTPAQLYRFRRGVLLLAHCVHGALTRGVEDHGHAAAEIVRKDHLWINHQRTGRVIDGQIESHSAILAQHIAAGDFAPAVAFLLIDVWRVLADFAHRRVHHQIARFV